MITTAGGPARIAWPQDLEPMSLIPLPELDRLVLLLRHSERGVWAFCLYNTAPIRDVVVNALRGRLSELPIYEFTLSAEQPDPLAFLLSLEPRRAVVMFYDAWRAFERGFFGHLDLQREQFTRLPFSLLFWIYEEDRAAIARRAPNFYSRHAGVFDFRVVVPQKAQAVRDHWAAASLAWDSVEERERQERLYLGLLAEYERDPAADQATVAGLWGKLAEIWRFKGELERASKALERQIRILDDLNDVPGRALALANLADILIRRGDWDKALNKLQEVLPQLDHPDAARARAEVLDRIADVLQARGQLDEALRIRREEVLPVYERLGDVRSRAVTLGKIADVLQARGQLDEALRIRREEVLPVYERLGDVRELLVGRAKLAIALLQRDAPGDRDEARQLLTLALEAARKLRIPEEQIIAQQLAGL